jgi:hypothetical protein
MHAKPSCLEYWFYIQSVSRFDACKQCRRAAEFRNISKSLFAKFRNLVFAGITGIEKPFEKMAGIYPNVA